MPKILVVSMRTPYPPHSGYQVTMFNYLIALQKLGYRIDLFCVEDLYCENQMEILKELQSKIPAVENISFIYIPRMMRIIGALISYLQGKPLQVGYFSNFMSKRALKLFRKNEKYDQILVHFVRLVEIIPDAELCKATIFAGDAISMNYYSSLINLRGFNRIIYQIEAPRIKQYEKSKYRESKAVFFHSNIDAEYLELQNIAKIIPILKPVIANPLPITEKTTKRFIFIGKLSYLPNEMGVKKLLDIFANDSEKQYQIDLIGSDLSTELKREVEKHPIFNYLGIVDDLASAIQDSYGVLSPIQMGAGMTNKILDAIVNARPSIASSFSATPYKHFLELITGRPILLEDAGILEYEKDRDLPEICDMLIKNLDKVNLYSRNAQEIATYFSSKHLPDYFRSVFFE